MSKQVQTEDIYARALSKDPGLAPLIERLKGNPAKTCPAADAYKAKPNGAKIFSDFIVGRVLGYALEASEQNNISFADLFQDTSLLLAEKYLKSELSAQAITMRMYTETMRLATRKVEQEDVNTTLLYANPLHAMPHNPIEYEDFTETEAFKDLLEEDLINALGKLTPREERVLLMSYGIGPYLPIPKNEIGVFFDVGGERIRQIEAKGLRKLRHPVRAKKLRGYLD